MARKQLSLRVRLALSSLSMAACLCANGARAADAVVTLVRPRGASALADEATSRLSAELRAAGFSVRTVTSGGGDARAEVERADGSFATIAIVPTSRGAGADVWIADRITGKTVVRRVDALDPARANAASDLAVRSAELLRASLLEARARPPAKALPEPIARFADTVPDPHAAPDPSAAPLGQASPPAPSTRPTPAPSAPPSPPSAAPHEPSPTPMAPAAAAPPGRGPRVSVEAAVAMLASLQGGPSFRPLLRVSADLPRRFSVRLAASPEIVPTTLDAPQGSIAFHQSFASLDIAYAFSDRAATIRPTVSLGGGVYELRVDGTANQGFRGKHGQALSGLLSISAGVAVRVGGGVSLMASLSELILLPGQAVIAVGKPLASLGRPAFLPSVGLVAEVF